MVLRKSGSGDYLLANIKEEDFPMEPDDDVEPTQQEDVEHSSEKRQE